MQRRDPSDDCPRESIIQLTRRQVSFLNNAHVMLHVSDHEVANRADQWVKIEYIIEPPPLVRTMAKPRRTIVATLPTYQRDRRQWRQDILANVLAAAAGVEYEHNDPLEVVVLLYLSRGKRVAIHDVDNRLKDILDALQGRFGGSKIRGNERRLIENDNQVRRVLIEKQEIPKMFGNEGGGKLLIRPYRPHRWPLQPTKANRLGKHRK